VISRSQVTDADRKGLAGVFSFRYCGEAWIRSSARKATDCWYCREGISPGEQTWRPLNGNGRNRMQRLHADCGLAIVLDIAGAIRA
jgi:hypothetical protein